MHFESSLFFFGRASFLRTLDCPPHFSVFFGRGAATKNQKVTSSESFRVTRKDVKWARKITSTILTPPRFSVFFGRGAKRKFADCNGVIQKEIDVFGILSAPLIRTRIATNKCFPPQSLQDFSLIEAMPFWNGSR